MAQCPRCENPMIVFERGGVQVDSCLGCGGTWLDAGELELIFERAGMTPEETARVLQPRKSGTRGQRPCPRCGKKMRVERVGGEHAVEIDRCPRGHGIWLDRGEMRALVASSEGRAARAVAQFLAEMYRAEFATEDTTGGNNLDEGKGE